MEDNVFKELKEEVKEMIEEVKNEQKIIGTDHLAMHLALRCIELGLNNPDDRYAMLIEARSILQSALPREERP